MSPTHLVATRPPGPARVLPATTTTTTTTVSFILTGLTYPIYCPDSHPFTGSGIACFRFPLSPQSPSPPPTDEVQGGGGGGGGGRRGEKEGCMGGGGIDRERRKGKRTVAGRDGGRGVGEG
ncbi:hypothetical protein Pcinc_042100 [Petrolisthes cinctipes]|uniref:Uncharacterized protein n=1 Tax=Petrolisthes cinctipes TaxID=88211 RepID=A0AAE1EHP3_PETCI|nr:hypothetical protein Pcinc_042100 [Petrolisthes cinctipes]